MTKWIGPLILLICLTSCITKPPHPPGMKARIAKRSLPQVVLPKAESVPGFSVTNIVLNGSQVTIEWQEGQPPFLIEGEPSLAGPWSQVGEPTMRHSATFDTDQNHFWRVIQQVPLLSITSTNPTTLEWLSPELSMGDTLSPFIIQRRTDEPTVGNGFAADDDNGWTNCPTTPGVITTCPTPVDPSKGTEANKYTATDTADPNGSPTKKYNYRIKEVTGNGVRVPCNFMGAGSVAPGTINWLRALLGVCGGVAYQVKTDSVGNVIVVGYFYGTTDFGGGPVSSGNLASTYWTIFIAKYTKDNQLIWLKHVGGVDGSSAALSVDVDSNDNIIVLGYFHGTINLGGNDLVATGFSLFLAKFLPDLTGTHVWSERFVGPIDTANMAVAVDSTSVVNNNKDVVLLCSPSGTIDFGGGHIVGSNSGPSTLGVARFSGLNGVCTWAYARGSLVQGTARGIAVDKFGDVVVTGQFTSGATDLGGGTMTASGAANIFFAKYSGLDGSHKWSKAAGNSGANAGDAVATDPITGNMVFGGNFDGTLNLGGPSAIGSFGGMFLVGYDLLGNWLWNKAYGASGNGAYALSIRDGSLALTGIGARIDWKEDGVYKSMSGYFLTLFTISGNLPPVFQWFVPGQGRGAVGHGVAFDSFNHVLTCGEFLGTYDFGGKSATNPSTLFPQAFWGQYSR